MSVVIEGSGTMPAAASPPDVLTLRQAADYLQVHPRTMGDMARAGRVPGARVGNRWRFLRASLDAWLQEKETQAGSEGTW